jgi:hypothetical protein
MPSLPPPGKRVLGCSSTRHRHRAGSRWTARLWTTSCAAPTSGCWHREERRSWRSVLTARSSCARWRWAGTPATTRGPPSTGRPFGWRRTPAGSTSPRRGSPGRARRTPSSCWPPSTGRRSGRTTSGWRMHSSPVSGLCRRDPPSSRRPSRRDRRAGYRRDSHRRSRRAGPGVVPPLQQLGGRGSGGRRPGALKGWARQSGSRPTDRWWEARAVPGDQVAGPVSKTGTGSRDRPLADTSFGEVRLLRAGPRAAGISARAMVIAVSAVDLPLRSHREPHPSVT